MSSGYPFRNDRDFGRECIVNSLPVAVVPNRGFNMYFPMPFRKKAKITLENQHANPIPAFFYQVDYCLYDSLPEDISYFHAQWRRQRLTEKQKDYVILDEVKGKGHYVGTYLALTTLERYWWGEGEMKFYLDGDDELIHNFYHNDDCPPMRGFYRWHIQDPICFDEDIRVTIQQIGVGYRGLFERQDDVASVAYWYQSEPHNPFGPLMEKEERWPR